MSANASSTSPIRLFSYYKAYYQGSTDANLLMGSDDGTYPTSAAVATLTGASSYGYPPSLIKRIRLHIASAFNAGVRDDFRDIVLRLGS